MPAKNDKYWKHLVHMRSEIPVLNAFKPLKIGTFDELVKRYSDVPEKVTRFALTRHCHGIHYQRALAAKGSKRHDLEGNVIEPVSAEHRQMAQKRVDEVMKRRKEAALAQQATKLRPKPDANLKRPRRDASTKAAPPTVITKPRPQTSINAVKPTLSLKRKTP